jgi:hypothetical protein
MAHKILVTTSGFDYPDFRKPREIKKTNNQFDSFGVNNILLLDLP